MRTVSKIVLLGTMAAAMGGCLPLTVASAIGMVTGGGDGPSAKGTNTSPFRENQWIKDKGPELYQATEAVVLEECTRQLETPAVDGLEEDGGPGRCMRRKRCLPGNRVPVDLLMCGPDGRPSIQHIEAAGAVAQISNWVWEESASVMPERGDD